MDWRIIDVWQLTYNTTRHQSDINQTFTIANMANMANMANVVINVPAFLQDNEIHVPIYKIGKETLVFIDRGFYDAMAPDSAAMQQVSRQSLPDKKISQFYLRKEVDVFTCDTTCDIVNLVENAWFTKERVYDSRFDMIMSLSQSPDFKQEIGPLKIGRGITRTACLNIYENFEKVICNMIVCNAASACPDSPDSPKIGHKKTIELIKSIKAFQFPAKSFQLQIRPPPMHTFEDRERMQDRLREERDQRLSMKIHEAGYRGVVKVLSDEMNKYASAAKIQAVWRCVNTNPYHPICKNRLEREYADMGMSMGACA